MNKSVKSKHRQFDIHMFRARWCRGRSKLKEKVDLIVKVKLGLKEKVLEFTSGKYSFGYFILSKHVLSLKS